VGTDRRGRLTAEHRYQKDKIAAVKLKALAAGIELSR
jgi:hypothetical protein